MTNLFKTLDKRSDLIYKYIEYVFNSIPVRRFGCAYYFRKEAGV